jgi:hypothetical protein
MIRNGTGEECDANGLSNDTVSPDPSAVDGQISMRPPLDRVKFRSLRYALSVSCEWRENEMPAPVIHGAVCPIVDVEVSDVLWGRPGE